MLKTYAARLEERQVEALKALSNETRIPQAQLLRQAVDLLIERWKVDRDRLAFLRRLEARLDEDRGALERLAKQ
jgi:hypothetical protein